MIEDLPGLQAEERLSQGTIVMLPHMKKSARSKLWKAWTAIAQRAGRVAGGAGQTVARTFSDVADWFRKQGLGVE